MNQRLKRSLGYIAPFALLAVIYVALVSPRLNAAHDAEIEIAELRSRLTHVGVSLAPVAAGSPAASGVRAVERRIPAEDRVPAMLEQLAHLARDANANGAGAIRHLRIETGERVDLPAGNATMPQVASTSTDMPDPRLALFETALSYRPVTLSFDASYAALGRFIWDLRDLPTAVEIRSFEVTPPAKPLADAPGLLHVDLLLYAFQRVK